MATHPLRLYSRSAVVTDWTCERKRYWNYEHGGRGIVGDHTSIELYTGTVIHDGLAAIAHARLAGREIDIDLIATTAQQQMYEALMAQSVGEAEDESHAFAMEQSTLVEGLLRGFYRGVWPSLMAQYPKIRLIEQELVYHHDGLTFMSKPDLVVEDHEGSLVYVEYKSTSSKKESWVNSWQTAVQIHSTIRAIETGLKEKVTGVVVQGLYKGYESYGKQNSPFCYAYLKKGVPPMTEDQIAYEYKAGFKRSPTWELEGGVKKWVEEMPLDILANQFPQTPMIFVNQNLVDAFFKQRAVREREIEMAVGMIAHAGEDQEAVEMILNTAFEQKFESCTPYFGKGCAYRKLCHGHVESPLTEGFRWRESHHQLERDLHNAASCEKISRKDNA